MKFSLRLIPLVFTAMMLFPSLLFANRAVALDDALARTWARTDDPVAYAGVSRTWMWGPASFTTEILEDYVESPHGRRTVMYFDKSRMEITDPTAVDDGLWYVTNGLLVMELVTGQMQVGNSAFVERNPAEVNVAGDPDSGPTYAALNPARTAPALSEGATITQRMHPDGTVVEDAGLAGRGITAARYVSQTQHTVATPFWQFMTSSGTVLENGSYTNAPLFQDPFYATGFPIIEAYWTTVTVGGTPKDVLLQCFERRCLTYTPDNPAGWQVEAGNVGRHYYEWRYGSLPTNEPPVVEDPSEDPAACLNTEEDRFLELINAYRVENGLVPLTATRSLNVASYKHSLDMGVRNFFDHDNPDGETAWDRMAEEGYDYNTSMAENIAAGYPMAEAVFEGWRTSPGHNANMLNPDLAAIGIGLAVVEGGKYTNYWTTDFGGYVDAVANC